MKGDKWFKVVSVAGFVAAALFIIAGFLMMRHCKAVALIFAMSAPCIVMSFASLQMIKLNKE